MTNPDKHAAILLGIDTGGTFTDFVVYDGESLRIHKCLSTPAAPEQAILTGIRELGIDPRQLRLVHGSTVATNAVLERKGVRTAFITNRGFKDMLTIGRQARRELYNLQPTPLPPPVPEELCLETGGRLAADGSIVEALSGEDLAALRDTLQRLKPRAVAINLLFSFRDERFEREIADMIPEGVFVSRSSEVIPEYREYERGITTWLNAWVGPLIQGYLRKLHTALPGAAIAVMQSSGDTMDIDEAGRHAVRMLLSGPAGGLSAARFIGEYSGQSRLLTFDMGGTSTDVALIDGEIRLTSEGHIGPYPVGVPMVDMHTIGAGGGSIARVDTGGLLHVGPQSAGADPGPACYGRGGRDATVTDANLILGRLLSDHFLGGTMRLATRAAHGAIARIAEPLSMSVEETALGIVRVANEHMARALRTISVQRGIDPRRFTLLSFGGAGGLHVCALAEALDMTQALIPVHAGVLSALGMLVAPHGRRLSRTLNCLLAEIDDQSIDDDFAALERQGITALHLEGVASDRILLERSVDLRYRGQLTTLAVGWQDSANAAAAFHNLHTRSYGYHLGLPIELVNLRVAVREPRPTLDLPHRPTGHRHPPTGTARLYGIDMPVAVWERAELRGSQQLAGPALITDAVSSTFLAPGWHCCCDDYGNLILDRRS
ncbi:MAG: hydantoinase/oxoprolinase family protein [Gammaproteobacteria bacterium]